MDTQYKIILCIALHAERFAALVQSAVGRPLRIRHVRLATGERERFGRRDSCGGHLVALQ